MLAMRPKGSSGAAGASGNGPAGGQRGGGQWAGRNGGPGGVFFDPQQMLDRAPVIQLGDLKKGEAVRLVLTESTAGVTAIKLLAGVEPLLEAPEAQNLLANWSMNSGSSMGDTAQ
jgi:hypothetical protein